MAETCSITSDPEFNGRHRSLTSRIESEFNSILMSVRWSSGAAILVSGRCVGRERGRPVFGCMPPRENGRKPPPSLSITHIMCPRDFGSKLDIGETGEAAPYDRISGRWIIHPGEVPAEPGEFGDVEYQRARYGLPVSGGSDQMVQQKDFLLS